MQAFAEVVRAGKALYIGVSEWTAEQIREAHALAEDLGFSLVSNQPRYNALYRIIEAEVVPACQQLGVSQVVFSPMEQGILSGKYLPGAPPPEGSRATHESEGARFVRRVLRDDVLAAIQHLVPLAQEEAPHNGSACRGLGAAERQCRQRHYRWIASRPGDQQCRGCWTEAVAGDNGWDRFRTW